MLKLKSHQQKEGFCGPASLKIVLRFFGVKKSEKELGELMGCTRHKGVTGFEIVTAAEKLGFKGYVKDFSTLEEMREILARKIPVIVEWFSEIEPHFSVVARVDDNFVYLQDPEIGDMRKIELKTFDRIWFSFDGGIMKKKEDLVLRRMVVVEKK